MTDAKEYGRALFLITEEDSVSDKVRLDVQSAESAIKANPDYVKIIDSPALPKSERVELIDKAFGSLDVRLVNLLKILAENRSFYLFEKAARSYYAFYDEARGIVRVEAVTAVPLTKEQTAALERKLRQKQRGVYVISNTVDPSILGGIKLRYSGMQLDGSVKTRLDKFEEALKSTVI